MRYSRIVSDAGGFKTQEDSEHFSLIFNTEFSNLHLPEAIDATMAMVVHMCRLNCGNDFKPLSVNFVHPEPECSEHFFEYFKSEVRFYKTRNSILFSAQDIDKPLPGSNPHLASLNEKVISKYLLSIDKDDPSKIWLWAMSDNVRHNAVLNAVQTAEDVLQLNKTNGKPKDKS